MLAPHILFQGEFPPAWVGLAKKLARLTFGRGIRNKVWIVGDVAIRVENYPELGISKVWLRGLDPVGYQFFGCESRMFKVFEDPLVPGRRLPAGHWTWVAFRPKEVGDKPSVAFKARPLLSSLRASEDWAFDPDPTGSERRLVLYPVHQPDGMGVRVWRDPRRPEPWLATAWAEPAPHHGAYRSSGAMVSAPLIYDRGYDFAPTAFSGRRGVAQAPESDWYRGACVLRVGSDRFGDRRYIIMVDVDHVFYCYPMGLAGERQHPPQDPNKANVEAKYVKTSPAPLPEWVAREAVGRDATMTAARYAKTPMPKWEFSPAGDKAAAVVFERDEPFKDAYFSSARHAESGAKTEDVREDWPGLVEVEFRAEPTGPRLEDFRFQVALKRALRSKTDGRGYLAAAYAERDFPDVPGGVKYNDLLVLEHRYRLGPMFQPASAYDDPDRGYTVSDPALHVYQPPPVVAVAAITREGEDIVSWLSSYIARWGRHDPFAAASRFSPTLDDLDDKPPEPARAQMFSLHTAIHGLHLPTLTAILGTNATLTGICASGFAFPDGETMVQWGGPFCASAGLLTLFSLGKIEERRTVGHPKLKAALPGYFDLSHAALRPDGLTAVNLRATVDQIAFYPGPSEAGDLFQTPRYRMWPYPRAEDHPLTELQFADVTLDTGARDQDRIERKIAHSTVFAHWRGNAVAEIGGPNLYSHGLRTNPMFPDLYLVTVPTLYTLFDAGWLVRPGIRWVAADGLGPKRAPDGQIQVEPGSSDIRSYPLGIVLHARFAVAALVGLNNPHSNVAASPGGSYAAFVGPVAAPKGVVAMHPNISQPFAQLPASAVEGIEQMTLDAIRARWRAGEGYRDAKTSHIEQLNAAFGLSLAPENYHLRFKVVGGLLKVSPQTSAPNPLPDWRVHHPAEYDLQFLNGAHGGAGIFSPVAAATVKTVYINTSGGIHFPVTMPTMNEVDMGTSPTNATVAFPTPRMEGLLTPLPWRESP
ncbi:MAG TPA: hypothetical protein PLP22_01975 [Candidatus Competibacter sp.]|nr:hypothetical protein [Candidatus Competibacteraceae bacterium]HRE53544.1 hypothetical protein [Candidatus Competibacter sp.]HUM93273.1 hypothetical protein [Candidatus Competibacter sp.]